MATAHPGPTGKGPPVLLPVVLGAARALSVSNKQLNRQNNSDTSGHYV